MKMKYFNLRQILLLLIGVSLPVAGFAIDAGQMLENINDQLPYVFMAVTAFAYVAGIFFVMRGLMKLKTYGEMHGRGGGQHEGLSGAVSFIFIGAMLIYLPSGIDVLLTTVYGTTELSSYSSYASKPDTSEELWVILVNIVRAVGLISFIRGLMLFHKVGNHQAQPGTFSKGVTHAIGGAIAINIVGFINIIAKTLGI
jgi:hypothetical protein